ncbi:coproporphyrinogen-III oxidase family protein [Pandoraea soli]|uniref:Oxygen-independent coproporphyrinogen III oxidase n=1 Tax=Pandoraea soli TaxID=2508293 RepID=A0ABY6VW74_9BURK|nr:radical SAM protein [Pandoraea soli]VVD96369.1 oxygen-independent coproporphyrinogen III oxidase [Pandoraea soli]
MQLFSDAPLLKFDRQFPIYNFFFPGQRAAREGASVRKALQSGSQHATSRALYFHIPFCETICSFCPFTRGTFRNADVIENYVADLLKEIELKAAMVDLRAVPVRAIFFGGGTPSLLSPEQIRRIGESIRHHFDLSRIEEYSFEIEVKSLTEEKASAMQDIGVTHPRFGLQTFNPHWREMFDLTATLDQVHAATQCLTSRFPHQSFDLLYGMSGTDEDMLLRDLEQAVAMRTTNIDVYPIDNVMTQVTLHRKIAKAGYSPTSAARKFSMRLLADEFMRHAGFSPHNGHGYVRGRCSPDTVVSAEYSFVYHEHVYGYDDCDLLGFGVNAISAVFGHVMTNTHSRAIYHQTLGQGQLPTAVSEHEPALDYARPLILRLPYHGAVEKRLVDLSKVPEDVCDRLRRLIEAGLVDDAAESYRLTRLGWHWYVNMMVYLMPSRERAMLNRLVVTQLAPGERSMDISELRFAH